MLQLVVNGELVECEDAAAAGREVARRWLAPEPLRTAFLYEDGEPPSRDTFTAALTAASEAIVRGTWHNARSKRTSRKEEKTMKEHDRKLYFAYGSNLNAEGMAYRTPGVERVSTATLEDWRLTFRGVADIEPAEGRVVYGAVYLIDATHERALDRYEGAPTFYEQIEVEVATPEGGVLKAMTYVMTPRHRERLGLPSTHYYNSIAVGFEEWGLPIEELELALDEVRDEHRKRGVSAYYAQGKKRLMAVDGDRETEGERRRKRRAKRRREDEYRTSWDGMSPATIAMRALEAREEKRIADRADRDADLVRSLEATA